jgi:SAM-dependent methyltransferase
MKTRAVTERFGDRADAYERGRPGYPDALLVRLCEELSPGDVVADLGAGTGLLSEALVGRGYVLRLVEPNGPMREVAERRMAGRADVTVHPGSAEQTGLESGSVALVVAAQAFHWFEPVATRAELERILAPGGQLALMWNDPDEASPFMAGYAALLQAHRIDEVSISRSPDRSKQVARFFGPRGCRLIVFENPTMVDWAMLEARLSSSSYMPAQGSPGHAPMIAALQELFDAHAEDGQVRFDYTTALYLGDLS